MVKPTIKPIVKPTAPKQKQDQLIVNSTNKQIKKTELHLIFIVFLAFF